MLEIPKEELARHGLIAYRVGKYISHIGYLSLSRVKVENPYAKQLRQLKKEKAVFFYIGIHRSLWETTGILSSISFQGLPIPFIGMGDNLVKGKFFQKIAHKLGIFLVKRATNRREMIESAQKLKKHLMYNLAHNNDVCIFPEGTRRGIPDRNQYGNFFPTAFDAALSYEKEREKILDTYKELKPHDVYLIPFNIDYSKIREDHEMAHDNSAKPSTLHIFDSLKMLKHIGRVHISYGTPIKVRDNLDMNRKQLATYTRERCLELVKVLPINIVAHAFVKALEAEETDINKIPSYITQCIERLSFVKDRFRDFDPQADPASILAKVARKAPEFRVLKPQLLPFYRMYAAYIHHYCHQEAPTAD